MSQARVATIAIIALVVVDVVLVAVALRPSSPSGDGAARVVAEQPTPAASSEPVATATEQAPSEQPPPPAVPLRRLLDASSSSDAWRLETGTCPGGGGFVERTTDGGQSWQRAETGQDAFVRLKDQGGPAAWVVALDGEGCEPVFLGTSTGGQEWTARPGSLGAAWYVEPADRTAVRSPDGSRAGPCGADVADLAAVTSSRAGLLCPDGRVFTTGDAALSWAERVGVSGAVALTDAGDGYLVASLGARGCPGVQVVAAGEGTAEALGCAPVPGEAGTVAISVSGDSVWLWAGDVVQVSGDGGRTWG